jgi:nitrite reductase/ring-hydroxylating ferredoxin subunit
VSDIHDIFSEVYVLHQHTTTSFPRQALLMRNLILFLAVFSLPSDSWTASSLPRGSSIRSATTRLTSVGLKSPKDALLEYNWKEQWYALTYSSYVPNPSESAEVIPAAVFGDPLVLWREEDNGEIFCARDVCPHRAAALSEGRVRDGTLQCLYHGWQFSGKENGACTRIPQLESKALIPKRACLDMKTCRVDEGLVWVWFGDSLPTKDPPRTGVLDAEGKAKGWNVYDFMIDLPYDHSYLVENLLDPAHIAISHDRTPGGGRRENAAAYEMHVDEDSINSQGFTGHFRLASDKDRSFTNFTFEAPGIVRNKFSGSLNGNPFTFEAGLHCMPVALGRSRLFFRVYNRGLPWIANFILSLKPTWLRHLNSCKVLEQDVGLITTQEDHFARHPDRMLKDQYILIKSSDTYVEAYRKWMDRVGHGMPWFQGLASACGQPNVSGAASTVSPGLGLANHRASNQDVVETRYHRHVLHSPVTRTALRNIQLLKHASLFVAGAALTTSTTLLLSFAAQQQPTATHLRACRAAALVLPFAGIVATVLHFLEREFYVSFKRKNQLRGESGLVP